MRHHTLAPRVAACLLLTAITRADIYKWEYIDPNDPSQGKQPSTTVVPGGAGVNAVPSANLRDRNLTMAYLIGANLTKADLYGATLADADLSNAVIREAILSRTTDNGFSSAQLYSTASYQTNDLTGVQFFDNDVSGWNFAGQNLTDSSFQAGNLAGTDLSHTNLTRAYFFAATLAGAQLTGSDVRGANLGRTTGIRGFTAAQLYSTASYQAGDLTGIKLGSNEFPGVNFASKNLTDGVFNQTDLTNADFSNANLTNAFFDDALLTGADFTGADIRDAQFGHGTLNGFTAGQLYSTASYLAKDLTGLGLPGNDLTGWNFAGQELSRAFFARSTLINADFNQAILTSAHFESAFGNSILTGARFRQADLRGAVMHAADLTGVDFSDANLSNAILQSAPLSGADFSGAIVRRADFTSTVATGFTPAQLYSTASYQVRELTGIRLGQNDLTGIHLARQNLANASFPQSKLINADLSHANLTNAFFTGAVMTGADLTSADTRGAQSLVLTGAIVSNLIRPDGTVAGLDLSGGRSLPIRNHLWFGTLPPNPPFTPIPVKVQQQLNMDPTSLLEMEFDSEVWKSTVSFDPGIPVSLGGTLHLSFVARITPQSQIGRTFKLFDWTGVTPAGSFVVDSPYVWDTSQLYSRGEVTLLAVPEPAGAVLCAVAPIVAIVIFNSRDARTRRR